MSKKLTPAALEAELALRLAARDHMTDWLSYREAPFRPAKHHAILIDALEAVERGDIRRLMVVMPPGSAKSTYSSVEFPPWFLGRNPTANVIGASNTADLAERF